MTYTVQTPGKYPLIGQMTQSVGSVFSWAVGGSLIKAPRWWSNLRDDWLSSLPRREGNDLLAGAVSTLTSKIAAANFYLEGPKDLAEVYMKMLLSADFEAGWATFISKWVQSYLCRDGGGLAERLRVSGTDKDGPASGFAHLDESRCLYTGNPVYPVVYINDDGKMIKMHRSQVMRITDMPSSRDEDMGVGFSAVSRSLSTSHILMDLVRYKRERLSDLPPAGIMFINNMTERQWQDIITKYDTRQRNEGNQVWRDLLVAIGLDPEYQVGAELFELSRLWDSYDERTVTEIAIYTFALAFRVDPREYWPVSSGQMGTATEAQIQHLKAKAKGEGIIFADIERQLNSPYTIPRELLFRFDYRDVDEDMRQAEVEKAQIENIRRLWESSPNRQPVRFPPVGGVDPPVQEDAEAVQTKPSLPAVDSGTGELAPKNVSDGPMAPFLNEGMISTEEARIMLARKGLIPAEFITKEPGGRGREYAIRNWGPLVRVYKDGYIVGL